MDNGVDVGKSLDTDVKVGADSTKASTRPEEQAGLKPEDLGLHPQKPRRPAR
jgi:hypothetical protein